MNPFFVYGTLLPGQPNHFLLRNAVVKMETAVFPNGLLYNMGSYPMMIEQPGKQVKGKLFTIDPAFYETVMSNLDTLEGYNPDQPTRSTYCRMQRAVELENGRSVTAWTYLGQPKYVKGLSPIHSGDWIAHLNVTLQQINSWWTATHSVAGFYETKNDEQTSK